jgi:hypothetical protein
VQLVSQRSSLLAEAGFALLLPSGLRQGQRLGMRARTLAAPASKRGKTAPAGGGAGLNLNGMVRFAWQAVLGDRPLSAAELASLEWAAALKRPLVRLRGQWSQVDGAAGRRPAAPGWPAGRGERRRPAAQCSWPRATGSAAGAGAGGGGGFRAARRAVGGRSAPARRGHGHPRGVPGRAAALPAAGPAGWCFRAG